MYSLIENSSLNYQLVKDNYYIFVFYSSVSLRLNGLDLNKKKNRKLKPTKYYSTSFKIKLENKFVLHLLLIK